MSDQLGLVERLQRMRGPWLGDGFTRVNTSEIVDEIKRLRHVIRIWELQTSSDHTYEGFCPEPNLWHSRDPECPVCAELLKLESASQPEPQPGTAALPEPSASP